MMRLPEVTRLTCVLLGVLVARVAQGGEECVVFTELTPVFAATQPDAELKEGSPPSGPEIGKFEAGQEARVLWVSDFKDQVVYRVAMSGGGEGLVYYGRGKFSTPQPCKAR